MRVRESPPLPLLNLSGRGVFLRNFLDTSLGGSFLDFGRCGIACGRSEFNSVFDTTRNSHVGTTLAPDFFSLDTPLGTIVDSQVSGNGHLNVTKFIGRCRIKRSVVDTEFCLMYTDNLETDEILSCRRELVGVT